MLREAGMKTGPVTEPPPPVSQEIASDLISASEKDPKGLNAPGQDTVGETGGEPRKEKSEKERTKPQNPAD